MTRMTKRVRLQVCRAYKDYKVLLFLHDEYRITSVPGKLFDAHKGQPPTRLWWYRQNLQDAVQRSALALLQLPGKRVVVMTSAVLSCRRVKFRCAAA